MSNSTTNLPQISSTQATKEVVANGLFDAASPATIWGRNFSTTSGLTWGYLGGTAADSTGALHQVANGTLTLTASATNYVYATITSAAVTIGLNTTGFPAGSVPLYSIITGASTVTSYTDQRSYQPSAVGMANPMSAAGDLIIGGVGGAPARLAAGSAGQVLSMGSSAPGWSAAPAMANLADVNVTSPQNGQMLAYGGAAGKWLNTMPPDDDGIVDGNFDFWDLGTSFSLTLSNTDVFTSDMCICNPGINGAATISQTIRTLGSGPSTLTPCSVNLLTFNQTTGSGSANVPLMKWIVEGVERYAGSQITFSINVVTDSAFTLNGGFQVQQNFGTGGSPSGTVFSGQSFSWAVSTTEQRFSVTCDVPVLTSSQVKGTAGDDYVALVILLPAETTFNISVSQAQVDRGPVALPFRFRGLQAERARVDRHLRCINFSAATGAKQLPVGQMWTSTLCICPLYLPTPMRGVPAVIYDSITNLFVAASLSGSAVITPVTGASVDNVGTTMVSSNFNVGAGLLSNAVPAFIQGAGGQIILDARLG